MTEGLHHMTEHLNSSVPATDTLSAEERIAAELADPWIDQMIIDLEAKELERGKAIADRRYYLFVTVFMWWNIGFTAFAGFKTIEAFLAYKRIDLSSLLSTAESGYFVDSSEEERNSVNFVELEEKRR